MTTPTTDTRRETKPAKSQRDATLSPDGKWRSFPKVPNLLQYVNTGKYFGRVKIDGKIFRESLETDVFTTAKLLLCDFIKKKQKRAARPVAGTFAEARAIYEAEVNADHTLKEGSKLYRRNSIKALLRTWPELDTIRPDKITESECRAWANRFSEKYDGRFFNNTLSSLRHILERAGIGRDENPAYKIRRLGVNPTILQLPEPQQFDQLIEAIENGGSRFSRHCADLVRFLAFSGCRISEARNVTWADVDMKRDEIRVQTSKRKRTSNAHLTRQVPIIPAMKQLLERLQREQNPKPSDRVCVVGECEKALTSACGVKNGERLKRVRRGKEVLLGIGIERITHHDLRHLFATRCIEAGVDIPTVSHWLGHSDGGGLAMKTYGHLRREHSAAMASKVTF
jgi:integrase